MPYIEVLKKPMSRKQIEKALDKDGFVTGVISIDIDEINKFDYESFLNLISMRLIGNDLLQDISYRVVGHKSPGDIHLEVTGNPSEAMEFTEEES